MPRKTSMPYEPGEGYTTIRVSEATADHIRDIRDTLAEWMLSSCDQANRRVALSLTMDHVIRIVTATFSRDYNINQCEKK